jgi:hypothetical protein
MPIRDLQRRLREIGRIRAGSSTTKGGRKVPSKLETWRLTSPTRELIEAAAELYGGHVVPWEREFEVITEVAVLDIVIPPGQSFTQWNELWAGGGCVRRCDGQVNVLTMTECACPADPLARAELAKRGEACKPTSRLSVMLPALPDLGVWRLESHGFYAAVELAGAADVLAMATSAGRLIPARLRLEQREKKVPGRPTNRYAVPVIEFVQTRMADLELDLSGAVAAPRLGAGSGGRPPALMAPRADLPESSDFRAPVPTGPLPLAERLRADVVRWAGLAGPPTDDQRTTLGALFAGVAMPAVVAGIRIAFEHPTLESGAEAESIVSVAAATGPAFLDEWAAMVAEGEQA